MVLLEQTKTLDGWLYSGQAVKETITLTMASLRRISPKDAIKQAHDTITKVGKQNGYKVLQTQIDYDTHCLFSGYICDDVFTITIWHVPPQPHQVGINEDIKSLQFEVIPIWDLVAVVLSAVVVGYIIIRILEAVAQVTWKGIAGVALIGGVVVVYLLTKSGRSVKSLY